MLLQISAQQRCVELGFEAKVVLDDNGLHIGIHHYADDALFKTRHRDRFIHKWVFWTTKLTQFNTSLAYLFGSWIIAYDQHLKVGFGQVTRIKVIFEQAITRFRLSVLPQLPCIHGTTIRTRDDGLGDAVR